MRSQDSNSGQSSSKSTSEQKQSNKKSVFDRLGRQLSFSDCSSMKRRPSPSHYGDYMGPPVPPGPSLGGPPSSQVHDPEFGRYTNRVAPPPPDHHSQAELEWRYQNERRHLAAFSRGDRHSQQLAPPPPQGGHYEMEAVHRQPPYFPPHPYQLQPGPPGPPMLGSQMAPMSMQQQQRSSPKYDRHGNFVAGDFKESPMGRPGPMDQHHSTHPGMSPPRGFMGPPMGMLHPHDMPPYPPQHRWHEAMEPLPPDFGSLPGGPRPMMCPEDRFSPLNLRNRYQHQPILMNTPQAPGSELPRYAKWRERRDVITNLDRETAQSSSRTDSLKSTLQQQQPGVSRVQQPSEQTSSTAPVTKVTKTAKISDTELSNTPSVIKESASKVSKGPQTSAKQGEPPQDISDGEIVDDEDSSDDCETTNSQILAARDARIEHGHQNYPAHMKRSSKEPEYATARGRESQDRFSLSSHYNHRQQQQQYQEPSKKRRMLNEREEYSMDYETISEDEDLDAFMGNKKSSDIGGENSKLADSRLDDFERNNKGSSEIELLNALGLDWANLVEMAKQSKTSAKDTNQASFLTRFSMPNYLPTLGITAELAGPELYDLITIICRA